MSENTAQEVETGFPAPDPALERLDRLVGTWALMGHLVGSDEENISGEIPFAGWKAASFSSRTRTSSSPVCSRWTPTS